jgi:hypothetical protein
VAAEWYRQSEGGSEEREAARTAAARVLAASRLRFDAASRLRWEAAYEEKRVKVAKRVAKNPPYEPPRPPEL